MVAWLLLLLTEVLDMHSRRPVWRRLGYKSYSVMNVSTKISKENLYLGVGIMWHNQNLCRQPQKGWRLTLWVWSRRRSRDSKKIAQRRHQEHSDAKNTDSLLRKPAAVTKASLSMKAHRLYGARMWSCDCCVVLLLALSCQCIYSRRRAWNCRTQCLLC